MRKPIEDEIEDIIMRGSHDPLPKLPKHVGLSIDHNEHKLYYQTVEQYITETRTVWVPGDSRQRAIDTDDMWSVQWYPDTPIGFCRVHGHTLQDILDYINE